MLRWKVILVLVLYTASLLFVVQTPVQAIISSCSASVDQHSVVPGSTTNFTVQLTNTDDDPIRWIRINRPSTEFTITSNSASGWQSTTSSRYAQQTNGSLAPGQSMTINITAQVGNNEMPSANWTVLTSDQSGVNVFTCGGNLGTAISSFVPDTTAPNISNITSSNITSTSATINWTTDEPASSQVSYGLSSSYGASTSADNTLKTSHSANISGLDPGTGYHFKATSTDGSNNTANSLDNTFLTANSLTTNDSANTSGSGATSSLLSVSLKTKIPIKDTPTEKVAPVVNISTDLSKPYKTPPAISGKISDNEAIANIEYSVDGGQNWLLADTDSGLGTKQATFSFTPINLDEGNYQILVRAIDTSGNIGLSGIKTLVIDRLPPQVGGSNISAGPQIFQPGEDGVVYSLVGVDQKITFSAIGGATQIVIDAKDVSGKSVSKVFSLTKSQDTGLWSGIISFEKPGEYILTANSVDGANNKTSKVVSSVQALSPGRITSNNQPLKDAEVVLYYQEPTTKTWTIWDGASYGQPNPQKTNEQGQFNLYVPPGKYYLKANAKNHRTLVSNIFESKDNMPILSSFNMEETKGFKVGSKKIYFPEIFSDEIIIDPPKLPAKKSHKSKEFIGKQMTDVQLFDQAGNTVISGEYIGKPTVITFISSWSPAAKEQMAVLSKLQTNKNINVIPVVAQERSGKIKSIISISGLPLDALTDPDGVATDLYKIQSLPTTYIIDKNGLVKKVMVGVLSEEKISIALGSK